ncbi:TfpX/TfpZ family type IV pilin accessory protein [Cellvibrio sp. UBA7661]|uniref:TfpX/TfpZ family type IV pilin accessory protein n=1 Tax=Cellvibrio sp. UBA7661 TaxID=1946311 RepID=UPI002F354723
MKFRLFCFASHLLISFVIALLTVFVVFLVWYPSPLDKALGVADIFLLLLCIDVIIGPLLTLIVAKQGKKTLKMDLSIIGVLQIAALSYGLYIVAQGRPVWLVYNNNRFEVVQAYEAIANPQPSWGDFPLSLTGPIWGAVIEPVPAAVARRDAFYQAALLQKYELVANKNGSNAMPIEVLKRFNNADKVDQEAGKYPAANSYIPMIGKQKPMVVFVDKRTGEVIAIVDLAPW